jgi:hypothetical protein
VAGSWLIAIGVDLVDHPSSVSKMAKTWTARRKKWIQTPVRVDNDASRQSINGEPLISAAA